MHFQLCKGIQKSETTQNLFRIVIKILPKLAYCLSLSEDFEERFAEG